MATHTERIITRVFGGSGFGREDGMNASGSPRRSTSGEHPCPAAKRQRVSIGQSVTAQRPEGAADIEADFIFLSESEVRGIEKEVHYQEYDLSDLLSTCFAEIVGSPKTSPTSSCDGPKNSSANTSLPLLKSAWAKIRALKDLLNREKTKINRYQLNMTKQERHADYGNAYGLNPKTKDVDLARVLWNFDEFECHKGMIGMESDQLKTRILMDVFYAKLTDAIYLMHFKKELLEEFNLKRFSNAALKMTEVLVKEELVEAAVSSPTTAPVSSSASADHGAQERKKTLRHFANAELPGSFLCAVNCHLRLHCNANSCSEQAASASTSTHIADYDWVGNSLLPGDMGPNSPGLPDYWGFYEQHPDRWLMREEFSSQIVRLLQQTRLFSEVNTSDEKLVHLIVKEPGKSQNRETKTMVTTVSEEKLYPTIAAKVGRIRVPQPEAGREGSRGSLSATRSSSCDVFVDMRSSSSPAGPGSAEEAKDAPGRTLLLFLETELKDMFANVACVEVLTGGEPTLASPGRGGKGICIRLTKKIRKSSSHDDEHAASSRTMNGDICDDGNLKYISDQFTSEKKVHLYTSDAGIGLDIDEFAEQEMVESRLKLAEVVCALLSLRPNGSMMIKMYTFFERVTIEVLVLLSKYWFRELKVVKPMSSKPTNSEVYLVGKGFLGGERSQTAAGREGGETTPADEINADTTMRKQILQLFLHKLKHWDAESVETIFSPAIPIGLSLDPADLSRFQAALEQLYYRQAMWINRNLFYMRKFWVSNGLEKRAKTVQDLQKQARRVQNELKPVVKAYFEKFVEDYGFVRKLTDEENEIVF
eukprot:g10638.t1